MTDKIKLFEQKQIRTHWDAESEEWYFSVVDVVGVLTEQVSPRNASTYWAVLKKRLKQEGADELLTNCKQLKMVSTDGKMRLTDVANTRQLLRIIQSIPSPKAEPFKLWLAKVSTTAISKAREPKTFAENKSVANEGGKIAHTARKNLEKQIGQTVISSLNASDKPALEIQGDYELLEE